jgi:hypothetical protein
MTAWSHLPNAAHIDQVLAHIQSFSIRPIPACDAARNTAWNAAWGELWNAERDAAWISAKRAARNALRDVTWEVAAVSVARDAARDAIMALIAYDHCDRYLTMTSDHLAVWSKLNADPASVLLLPYVTFMGTANALGVPAHLTQAQSIQTKAT